MRKFTVYQDKENIPVSAKRCPCVRKPIEKGKALQQISTNIQIPPSSTFQYSSRSSITAFKTTRENSIQSDCNYLAKREMTNIFQEEKRQLTLPAEYSRTKPKSANDVGHGTRFRYDLFERPTQNRESKILLSPIQKGFACSTFIDDSDQNASRRSSSSSRTTNRLYSDSTGKSLSQLDGIRGTSRIKVLQVEAVDPNSWYSLDSTDRSLSRQQRTSSNLNRYSEIPTNHLTAPETLLSERPRSQRSTKVKKRANINRCHSGYTGEDEYAQDMLYNLLLMEQKITLPVGFLKYFGPDQKTRATIVDWMLGLQEQTQLSDAELYLAVNLLDQILARSSVPTNMLQLIALITIWISNKYIGSDNLRASDLLWYANNTYTIRQLLAMERKILKILSYHIHYIEPSLCVDIFFKVLGLENPELAKFTAHYFLDCTTLLADFSSTPVTVLAAAVIIVAIRMYDPNSENMVLYYFRRNMSPKHNQRRLVAESQIYSQIALMRDENYMFRRAYYKNKAVKRNY